MKPVLPARVVLAFSLLIGLLAGALFEPLPVAAPLSYWQVQVSLYKNKPPVIESVVLVENTSPLHLLPGESSIQLLSASGQVLNQQTFQPNFSVGDLPGGVARVPYVFTLLDSPAAAFILLRTHQGETRYELRR